jgi:hypothetical protein
MPSKLKFFSSDGCKEMLRDGSWCKDYTHPFLVKFDVVGEF